MGMAIERVICHYINFGQQICQGADSGGFASTTIAHNHDPTNFRVNDIEQQRQFHFFLPDDRRKRKHRTTTGGSGLHRSTIFSYDGIRSWTHGLT
jgi:hypothetical protein